MGVMLWSLCAQPALAHPHFHFTYQFEPVFQAEGMSTPGRPPGEYRSEKHEGPPMTGLRVVWWVDALASAQIRQAADVNRNGQLDATELAAFARGNDRLMRMQRYFISALPVGVAEPLEFEVAAALSAEDHTEHGIRLSFELRFAVPVQGGAVRLRMFDPTWNVALTPHAAVLPQPGCRALRQDATLATVGWGEQLVATMLIECPPANSVRPLAQLTNPRRAHHQETQQ